VRVGSTGRRFVLDDICGWVLKLVDDSVGLPRLVHSVLEREVLVERHAIIGLVDHPVLWLVMR
jgi:hypothetical protein